MNVSHDPAIERWLTVREQAFDAVRETGESMSAPDPRGLLLLSEWVAGEAVAALHDSELKVVATALGASAPTLEQTRQQIVELVYDDLFSMLRLNGLLV